MAQLIIHTSTTHIFNTRQWLCPFAQRPPPVRTQNIVEPQPECSTSYGQTNLRYNSNRRRPILEAKRSAVPDEPTAPTRKTQKRSARPAPQPEDEGNELEDVFSDPDVARAPARRGRRETLPPGGVNLANNPDGSDAGADGGESSSIELHGAPERDPSVFYWRDDEMAARRDLTMQWVPRTRDEERKMASASQMEAYLARTWQHEEMDDWAFYEADKMMDKAHNIYANVHAVAGIMRKLEVQDFAAADKQTYFSSWSRAEVLFALEFDQFNESVKANMDSIVRQPLEEELRDRLEAIGEATLLPPTESEQAEPKFPTAGEVHRLVAETCLEGVLPGVSLANPLQRYDEEIYGGDGEDTVDELLNMAGAEADEEAGGEE